MFIGTLNNPAEHTALSYETYLQKWHEQKGVAFVTGQLEKGAEGTPHLQYFVQFEKTHKKTIAGLKKICKHSNFTIVK